MASKRLRIIITTGDLDGVGWEVTAKALADLGPRPGVQFVVVRAAVDIPQQRRFYQMLEQRVDRKFKRVTVISLEDAAKLGYQSTHLIEVRSQHLPPIWIEQAARLCLSGQFAALVTAPLSKTSIVAAHLKDLGHTEILGRIAKSPALFMGFVGTEFSVVLATGHKPLKDAIQSLNPELLAKAFAAAKTLRSTLSASRRRLPIGLLGLNPHAGEDGLIGSEEVGLKKFATSRAYVDQILGPLVPDSAFLPHIAKRVGVYLALYHDQGLIPFKLAHGFKSGVHVTLGLPFVRTSVDHGCAKDIFGQNMAEHGSMRDALLTAIRLVNKGPV